MHSSMLNLNHTNKIRIVYVLYAKTNSWLTNTSLLLLRGDANMQNWTKSSHNYQTSNTRAWHLISRFRWIPVCCYLRRVPTGHILGLSPPRHVRNALYGLFFKNPLKCHLNRYVFTIIIFILLCFLLSVYHTCCKSISFVPFQPLSAWKQISTCFTIFSLK